MNHLLNGNCQIRERNDVHTAYRLIFNFWGHKNAYVYICVYKCVYICVYMCIYAFV